MPQLLFTQTPLQPHFLLCGSCYWCASYFNLRGRVKTCPSCMNGKVESLPISDNEIYTLETFMGTQRDSLRS